MTLALDRRYRQLRAQAEASETDEPSNAAALYLDCASLLHALADATSQDRLKDSYQAQALALEERAEQLKLYGTPSARDAGAARDAGDMVLVVKPKVRFDDIAGLTEAKERVREAIVYPFLYPEEYAYFGVSAGGGILLYGPPGCGKTLLAAAAAAECDAVFINLKVSDIKDKYVGESEKNIRQVFEMVDREERSVVFFDEIDAIATMRGEHAAGYETSLVAELLSQMDGLERKGQERKSLVLAATNRPWDVDLALRRPGRFDTTVFVPQPDEGSRTQLLGIALEGKPLDDSLDLGLLSQKTDGLSGAEIADMCQRAARIPLRERLRCQTPRRPIGMNDFEQSLAETRSVLPPWYRQALNELELMEDRELFGDLARADHEFLKR